MVELHSLSASLQDYLETIFILEEDKKGARVTDIANKLNVAKASVNQTINKLVELELVNHKTYGPVELTKTGREIASKIIDKHKKLRDFLIKVLGVKPEIAEKDACSMEHVVSIETMDKLTSFLCRNGYISEGCEIYLEDEE